MLPQQRSRRLLIVFPNNGSVETSSNSPDRLLDNEKTIPQTVTTLTDWIEVRESQQAEELFGGTEPNWAGAGSLLSLDDLYDSKEKPGHELNLATDARAESLTSQEVPHATKTSIDEDFSTTAKEPEAKQSPNVTSCLSKRELI
ncbi:hypothetical protein M3Y99_00328400 [Aphelenchoides fujianensis]|nr:hypothetical protein M3Y99_00328400 [Aphelenchoides fujianensis]